MGGTPTASELSSIFSSGDANQQTEDSVNPTMTPSQDELAGVSGSQQNDFSMTQDKAFKSPINLGDRLRLSFADDRGKVAELQKEFQYVEPKGNGNFMVGQSANDSVPLNSDSVFEDTLSHIANTVGQIPAIAGQIAGTMAGAATAPVTGPAGAIAGAGIGSAIGEGVKQGIGKMLGVNKQTPEEMATDQVISGLFGSTGEALGLGVTKLAGKALAWKAIQKGVETSANPSFATKQVSSLFKVLGGVDKDVTTRILTEHGPEAAFSPTYMGKEYPSQLSSDWVKNLVTKRQDLGLEVKDGSQWFHSTFGKGEFPQQRGVSDVLTNLMTGLQDNNINPLGVGLKNEVSGVNPLHTNQFNNIVNTFFKGVTNEDGLIKWEPRNLTNSQALEAYDNLDSQLRGFWKQSDVSVDKRLQAVTAEFKNGIRQCLGNITVKEGDMVADQMGKMVLKPEALANNPFLRSRQKFAQLAQGSELLASQGGPDLTSIGDLKRNSLDGRILSKETGDFFRHYPDKAPETKMAFENLSKQLPEQQHFTNMRGEKIPLTEELQKYHDVQDLMKSNPSLMRISLVTSLMMLPGWPLLKMGIYELASSPQTVMKGISIIKRLGQATESQGMKNFASGMMRTGTAALSQRAKQSYLER